MTDRIRRRQPPGRPTGGQYAEESREPSGIHLADHTDRWAPTGEHVPEPRFELSATDLAHLENLVQRLHRSAPYVHATGRMGRAWDSEDLAQDTLVALLERARARGSVTEISPALARSVMRNTLARALNSHSRGLGAESHQRVTSSDLGAWREFTSRVDDLEQVADRLLSPAERDAVAREVRDQWPDQKRKPTRDFHRHRYDAPLEAAGLDLGKARGPSAEDEYLAWSHGGPDTERVLSMPTAGGATRKYAWNALCELRGIPKQPAGVLNNRQVTNCKKTVGETNQEVLSAVEEWESGLSNERTEALFRPFGAASQSHRAQIADLMRDMPGRAGQMYSLALAGATGRNFTREHTRAAA